MDDEIKKEELDNSEQYVDSASAFDDAEKKSPKSKKGLWAMFGALLVFLGKLKFVFIFLKLGKIISTFGSMFLMIVIYAQMYGWSFGIGFVLLLFIHEMGHYYVAKQVGLNVSAPLFIPFVGAFISMKEQPRDAVTEAKVALGGPVLGSAGALICLVVGTEIGSDFFLALAYSGFMINIFNLIPVHPLDGGRIVSAISPKLWLIGIPVMIVAAIVFFNPIIILFLILGIMQVYRQWKSPNEEYYNTPTQLRKIFAAIYFGLITLLGIGMFYVHSIHSTQF